MTTEAEIEAAARAAYIEDACVRGYSRKVAASRWDNGTLGNYAVQRTHWRNVMRAALEAAAAVRERGGLR